MSMSLFVSCFYSFADENFSYVAVPKAGSSTTLLTLINAHARKHGLAEVNAPRQPVGKSRTVGFRSQNRPPIGDVIRDRYLFTIVRNPFARVLSAYLDKVQRRKDSYLPFAKYMGIDPAKDISFTEFLTHLAAFRGKVLNIHWAPQASVIESRALRYDLVGTIETIGGDMDHILRNCGFSDAHIESRAPHAQQSGSKIAEFYDDTAIDIVREFYRDDFRLLGYSLDPNDPLSDASVRAEQIGGGRALSESYAGLFAAREHAEWEHYIEAAEELLNWLPGAAAMKLATWEDHLFAGGVFLTCRNFAAAKEQFEACLELEPQAVKARIGLQNLKRTRGRAVNPGIRRARQKRRRARALRDKT